MKITDALIAEHTIYLGVFVQIERALSGATTTHEVTNMARIIEGLLQGHAARETELAYLALDHVLADQGQLENMHQDHHEIDARLTKVQRAATCEEGRKLLRGAIKAARDHFSMEERFIFPLLEKALRAETLTELGQAWMRREPAVEAIA
jgi:hemerythrin-like domain-containing protein